MPAREPGNIFGQDGGVPQNTGNLGRWMNMLSSRSQAAAQKNRQEEAVKRAKGSDTLKLIRELGSLRLMQEVGDNDITSYGDKDYKRFQSESADYLGSIIDKTEGLSEDQRTILKESIPSLATGLRVDLEAQVRASKISAANRRENENERATETVAGQNLKQLLDSEKSYISTLENPSSLTDEDIENRVKAYEKAAYSMLRGVEGADRTILQNQVDNNVKRLRDNLGAARTIDQRSKEELRLREERKAREEREKAIRSKTANRREEEEKRRAAVERAKKSRDTQMMRSDVETILREANGVVDSITDQELMGIPPEELRGRLEGIFNFSAVTEQYQDRFFRDEIDALEFQENLINLSIQAQDAVATAYQKLSDRQNEIAVNLSVAESVSLLENASTPEDLQRAYGTIQDSFSKDGDFTNYFGLSDDEVAGYRDELKKIHDDRATQLWEARRMEDPVGAWDDMHKYLPDGHPDLFKNFSDYKSESIKDLDDMVATATSDMEFAVTATGLDDEYMEQKLSALDNSNRIVADMRKKGWISEGQYASYQIELLEAKAEVDQYNQINSNVDKVLDPSVEYERDTPFGQAEVDALNKRLLADFEAGNSSLDQHQQTLMRLMDVLPVTALDQLGAIKTINHELLQNALVVDDEGNKDLSRMEFVSQFVASDHRAKHLFSQEDLTQIMDYQRSRTMGGLNPEQAYSKVVAGEPAQVKAARDEFQSFMERAKAYGQGGNHQIGQFQTIMGQLNIPGLSLTRYAVDSEAFMRELEGRAEKYFLKSRDMNKAFKNAWGEISGDWEVGPGPGNSERMVPVPAIKKALGPDYMQILNDEFRARGLPGVDDPSNIFYTEGSSTIGVVRLDGKVEQLPLSQPREEFGGASMMETEYLQKKLQFHQNQATRYQSYADSMVADPGDEIGRGLRNLKRLVLPFTGDYEDFTPKYQSPAMKRKMEEIAGFHSKWAEYMTLKMEGRPMAVPFRAEKYSEAMRPRTPQEVDRIAGELWRDPLPTADKTPIGGDR